MEISVDDKRKFLLLLEAVTIKVQWCPDLVYPDLVDCRDIVD